MLSDQVSVTVDMTGIDRLLAELRNDIKQLDKELKTVLNTTAKFHARQLGKPESIIRKNLRISAKVIKQSIKVRTSSASTSPAVVVIKAGKRIGLGQFGARQRSRKGRPAGVTYRIRPGEPKSFVKEAFMPTKFAAQKLVFKRKGKGRLPITQLRGPSVEGAYTTNDGLQKFSIPEVSERLQVEAIKRLKFIRYKVESNARGAKYFR